MNIKKNDNFSLIFLIVLYIPRLLSQLTVYPDHYVPNDSPYSFSPLYLSSAIKERQIYKLGYFSTGSVIIQSYKNGLKYKPDNYCKGFNGGADKIATDDNNKFLSSLDQENTRDINNFSEELELLKNVCFDKSLIINAPFPTLHNTGYILRYKLIMINDASVDPEIDFRLRILRKNADDSISNIDNPLCKFQMKAGKADWFRMTIQSELSKSNQISMIFNCENSGDILSFDVNTDDEFQLIIGKDNNDFNIYLSFYQVILEDSTSSYLSSINDNRIIRTYNGLENCVDSGNINNINDIKENSCLIGYDCEINTNEGGKGECKSCDFTCFECKDLSCKQCGVLTDVGKTPQDDKTCEINNIDISNFKDFTFSVKVESNNEFHERSTLGVWVFISDLSKAKNGYSNIYHIALKDRYVLSIIPNELSVGVYIHAYEDLYRKITTETVIESNYVDRNSDYVLSRIIPSDEQLNYINGRDLSGQWFHVSCALSFDHKKFYVNTMINGEASYIERALRHENLYYDSAKGQYVENDIYNRHIIQNEEKLYVEFKNFGNAGTKIFLKYFLLFQEYIPPSFKFMYYDYYQDVDVNKQILIQANFGKLEKNTENGKYMIKTKNVDYEEESYDLETVVNKEIDLSAPINYKLLVLPPANTVYKKISCNNKAEYTKPLEKNGVQKINWDDNKPLFCTGYLYTQNDECFASAPCTINGNKYIIYPKETEDHGYCDFLCSGPMTCQNDYLSKQLTKPFKTGDTVGFCKTKDNTFDTNNIYNLFYSCENRETKYYLQYSSFYNPSKISIGVTPELKSYIIEIWYYPDFFLNDNSRQGKYYYPETKKNIVFYSNRVHAYFLHSEYKTLKVEDEYSTHTTPHYHPYEWNKLVFYGLTKDSKHYKYFIINNMIYEPIEFKHIYNGDLKLSSIVFFSNSEGSYIDAEVNYQWASGYYRGLRIWDGDKTSPPLTILYENLFSSEEKKVNSLISYYPLTNEYISDNRIYEINEINTGVNRVTSGSKRLRRYNFSSKFDFIRSQYPSLGYYLLADATQPKASQCGTGCLRCWNAGSNCYECVKGYTLTLERACIQVSKYYFLSPCLSQSSDANKCKAKLIIPDNVYKEKETDAISVTFWIKPLGFDSSTTHKIIQFSEKDYLEFSDVYTDNSGLMLKNELGIIANSKNFREKIGYWSFISLSYYNKKLKTTSDHTIYEKEYFPTMINFEVNEENLPIRKYNTLIYLKFDALEIFSEFVGLLFNIQFYHEYLIGAYGFATNDGNLISPFSIPLAVKSYLVPGTTPSDCFDSRDFYFNNGDNFGCAGENDRLFDTFATSYNNYITIESGFGQPYDCEFKNDYENSESNCLNACKGVDKFACSCLNRNYNSQMLIKGKSEKSNSYHIYCRTLDYINFSKAKKITINHVRTAKETKKFTLQFWIYFYSYKDETFGGVTFNWKGHNIITVFKKNKKYYTKCQTYTVDDGEITLDSTELELNIIKWNFISCSVNYEEALFYLNTNNDIDTNAYNVLDGPRLEHYRINPSVPPNFLVNNDWTTLEITENTVDYEDWGYLYYRQIHLWKFAYFNAEFLSRVDILSPSKFPYLLHTWDTYFKGYKDGNFHKNFIVKDICGIANDFNVTYTGPLGFNYIPEEDIKHIDLCSEDGEYYDIYLKKCLPFADLGLIDDFTFTEVPYSYSGSYSMAFWIFFEDSSTIGSGIHFKWERHLQITVIKYTQLQGYCLPQGYYSDDISNAQFSDKLNKIPNYASTNLLRDDQSESGVWIWVLCSVSNYKESFFIQGNGAIITKTIEREELYYSDLTDVNQPVRNAYPYHYFMSEVEDGVPQTSKLHLEGLANDKRIYIRDLFLFKDYIPEWYANAFKNIDLSQITEDWMLQSMIFVCNFADFNLNKMTLTYYVINQQKSGKESLFTKTKKIVKLYRTSKISSTKTFELCSNFAFIKIINPISGDLCKKNTTDTDPQYIFYYCNDELVPIVCRNLKYITLDDDGVSPVCHDECKHKLIRVPGAPSHSGICGIPPADNINVKNYIATSLLDYYGDKTLTCGTNYNQVGYKCYKSDLDEKSGFFFSRCYNQPNFYREISNESKEKLPSGYFYEFWFKLDKVQILQHCETTASEEYILFSTPHSIYLDLKENKYYYKIIESIYSRPLDGISDYEWNKIVIKTTLGVTLGQNVYVYINFDIDNIKATILNIPSSIKMQLQYISFCSKEDNGDCTPAGAMDVTWGSAYYRNIRVWEIYSSSIYTIQDFNIELYKEWPSSLKLFYPLTISEMNYNILNQAVGDDHLDSIKIEHEESSDFNSLDAYGFHNYATNFDWGVEEDQNKGHFISSMDGIQITSQECAVNCERCYTNAYTNCYKCNPSYVLKGMTCVYTEGKTYLKIPLSPRNPIEFQIENVPGYLGHIPSYPGITIHFYMKFEGVIQDISTTAPHIMELRGNTYIAYNTLTANLEFDIEGETAFRYTTFYDILGQWIPYSISIYVGRAPIPDRYPHMFTFSVNKEDIPFVNNYVLPESLQRISFLHLGNEVIALFADLRIYNTFIQGSFGNAISYKKDDSLILYYSLSGGGETDCLLPNQITNEITPICVTDYIDYIAKSCGKDLSKYFDLSIPGDEPCASCDEYCKTKCFNPEITQCSCNMTNGLYWLRRDKRTRVTYCQYLPSTDYSILKDVSFNVPVSKNFESTIEFWLFIYSYNSETSQFTSISLEWNLHNRIFIANRFNTITAYCYAFFDKDSEGRYSENIPLIITGYSWLYIRCGTDYISQTKKYFLNSQESELITQDYPNRDANLTTFEIKPEKPNSFGFVFLKEIKLWQQYNFKYINTQFINLVDDVGLYDVNILKSTGIYPGLITYIKSDFDQNNYEEVMTYDYQYRLENLIGKDEIGYVYKRTYIFKRDMQELVGFLGYNIVDPDNYGYYEDLIMCSEGYVFNSENQVCLEVSLTKCRYPGDISDNCISCPDENKYIYPPDGSCVSDCGPRFYPRDDMNQCRDCHWTCYTCWSYAYNNCLSCIDDRYYVESLHECVLFCQDYGYVASKVTPNLCVDFDFVARLVNYQEYEPIDINTFDYLIAEIVEISTRPYYTKWRFVPSKTRGANNRTLKFEDDEVPFEPNTEENLKNLNVTLNHSFFELRTDYIFTLDITSYNQINNSKTATRSVDFVLRMNSYPVDGHLEIIPSVGLHNTTIFLMRCQNWTDDTIQNETDLTYYFYAQEDLSNEIIVLQDWSTNNEIISSFALEKDALPSNDISIYCKIRDNYLAETEVVKKITLATDLNSRIYKLEEALNEYYLPDKQLNPVELYDLSEVLKSFGLDLYKALRPAYYQTIYKPSIDKDMVVKTEPECVTFDKECNNRGTCTINVDEFLVCRCEEGYIGTNCHIDKNPGSTLLDRYKELYSKLLGTMQSEITYYEFKVMHNLFNGAHYFSEDTTFFSNQMETFINMALNVYPNSIENNTYEYIDLLDYYYSYELYRLNTKRVTKMFNTGLPYRDLPIDEEDKAEFKEAFEYIHNQLISIIHYKCNMHLNTQISYSYSSDNFYIAIKSVNPTFDENEFFEERKNDYRTFPRFMSCLNYIENNKLNNPYFQTFMIYIEYLNFPFGYDEKIYENNTSPLIELRFLDATTGKIFDLTDCTGPYYINIDMPFTNYRWLDQINKQRELYDPRNYKAPDDPIFSDPIFINKSGYVSNDTVEQRIKKYHREYNFSCRYYDIEEFQFADTGVVFTNYTSDTNFIEFNTSHLSRFTTFFVLNNATFKVKGRFFYVPRTELMKWKGNYDGNFGLIVFIILIAVYIVFSLVLGCYDSIYFVQETLLESLKKEIVKVFLPYRNKKDKEKEAMKIIPIGLDPSLLDEKKFGDKKKENNRYGKKNDNEEENLDEGPKQKVGLATSVKTTIGSTDRILKSSFKNKSKEFLTRKKKGGDEIKQDNIMTTGNRTDLNLDLEIQNFYRSNIGKKEISELNPNRLPDVFENKDVEYKRRLNGYANLGLTFCEFFGKNFLQRNIFINPFFNISMFAPRWKKLIVFTTEVAIELLLLAVFLTNDENATENNLTLLIEYSAFTALITDTFMHFFTIFFQVSLRQKRKLLKLVLMSGQLIVLKEYEDMQCINGFVTFIGMIISLAIWAFSFYMSFTFYSVWKVQNKAFIYSFLITIAIDFLILEFIYELFLAIIYMQRKSSALLRRVGEFLNRIRNHRCMN